MPGNDPPRRPPSPRLVLRRADQAVAAVLLAVSLAAIAGWGIWHGRLRGRLIEIDEAPPIAVQFQVDVNTADWPELSLMPNIGEQLARRIVDDRAVNGPFRDLDDLRRVRGIGPKTLEGMKPYLTPLPQIEATAGGKTGELDSGPVN